MLAWGIAQFPYLIPPDLTFSTTASLPSVMGALLISAILGMVTLLPSLWLLLWLFKARNRPRPQLSTHRYIELLPLKAKQEVAPASHMDVRDWSNLKRWYPWLLVSSALLRSLLSLLLG